MNNSNINLHTIVTSILEHNRSNSCMWTIYLRFHIWDLESEMSEVFIVDF